MKGKADLTALGLTLANLIPSNVRIGELLIAANPQSAPADGKTAITIVATIFDAYGNPVPDGIPVSFEASGGSLSANTALTSRGLATVTLTSSQAGAVTVTAKSGDKTASITVQFTPVVSSITLTANPQSAPADGKTAVTITASILDGSGQPIPDGVEVTFSTTLGILSSTTATTSNGLASVTLTSTTSGIAQVSASAGNITSNTVTIQFNPTEDLLSYRKPTAYQVDNGSYNGINSPDKATDRNLATYTDFYGMSSIYPFYYLLYDLGNAYHIVRYRVITNSLQNSLAISFMDGTRRVLASFRFGGDTGEVPVDIPDVRYVKVDGPYYNTGYVAPFIYEVFAWGY